MPNYYNPYNMYPATYVSPLGYSGMQPVAPVQQSMAPVQSQPRPIEWVEGEIGAKAYQMPQGWPADTQIPLWDTTMPYIYFKSWNRMGMPNPLQKIKYDPTPVEVDSQMLPSGNSAPVDTEKFATKDDIAELRNELQKLQQNNMSEMSGMSNSQMNWGGQK